MKKDIEKTFFKAFQNGGVVDACIQIIRERYDLGLYPKSLPEQRKKQKEMSEEWRHYYEIILPDRINKETEDFDDTVISGYPSPIIEEIEENLKECKTNTETERYIFSLLIPFKGISDIFHPIADIKRLELHIEECKDNILKWQQSNYEHAKEQIEACKRLIETDTKNIERIRYINLRFCEISSEIHEKGTVERCLTAFLRLANMFANQLDALLLTYGIDLIRLQNESGIYLKNHRYITDVDYYIGSLELTRRYIDKLNKTETESIETEKLTKTNEPGEQNKSNGGRPKKEIDKTMTLKTILHEGLYNDAKKYYQTKLEKGKLKKGAQYGQLIREFATKDWIKPEYKKLSSEQMKILIFNEFNVIVSPDTARKDPKGNEFEEIQKRKTLQLPM